MLDEDYELESRKVTYQVADGRVEDYLSNFKKESDLDTNLLLVC